MHMIVARLTEPCDPLLHYRPIKVALVLFVWVARARDQMVSRDNADLSAAKFTPVDFVHGLLKGSFRLNLKTLRHRSRGSLRLGSARQTPFANRDRPHEIAFLLKQDGHGHEPLDDFRVGGGMQRRLGGSERTAARQSQRQQ